VLLLGDDHPFAAGRADHGRCGSTGRAAGRPDVLHGAVREVRQAAGRVRRPPAVFRGGTVAGRLGQRGRPAHAVPASRFGPQTRRRGGHDGAGQAYGRDVRRGAGQRHGPRAGRAGTGNPSRRPRLPDRVQTDAGELPMVLPSGFGGKQTQSRPGEF